MIRYIQRTLVKNKVLWAWPGLFFLFALVIFIWGDISSAQNSYSFLISLGALTLPSQMVISQLISIVVLFGIIGLPSHFADNLKSDRASLLLSKPISRSEFFFSDFAAMLSVTFSYTLICVVFLALLTGIKGAIFPYQFFITLLFFMPLLLLTYYVAIVLFLVVTHSYLAGALLGWLVVSFSPFFLNAGQYLDMFGIQSTVIHGILGILSYTIPSAGGIEQLIQGMLRNGFSAFDGGLWVFSLASCLPFGLLGYYLFRKKEF